ncbi:LCP family glycopolymer transferase [Granulicatella seriolae]|uniref:LCP family protein n=1 Tax=Granulicatella seriolae TaxID=2967226 RepID=A0ABT1WQP4_9LACT|nr:LCP family protein [Granulicatella seriolae]
MSQISRVNAKRKKKRGCLFRLLIMFCIISMGVVVFFWKVYSDLGDTTKKIYKSIETEQVRTEVVNVQTKKPLSILFLGVDTGDLGRTEQGRSDAMMVLTINPNKNKSTLVSIPRDTRSEIIGNGTVDKINHAYAFGGVAMSVNTVQNLLNIPIDYYVEVNMQGLREIIAALGSVEVVPNNTFTQDGYSFTQGISTQLDYNSVLPFVRNRYSDSDYGRQERHRLVIQAILNKVASLESIMKYSEILASLQNNMQTNLTFQDIQGLFFDYRSSLGNLQQIQLKGEGTTIDGIYYNIPDENQYLEVTKQLRSELEL